MTKFVAEHRDVYGVEPICRVLEIAPSTYYSHAAHQADPEARPDRWWRDRALETALEQALHARQLGVGQTVEVVARLAMGAGEILAQRLVLDQQHALRCHTTKGCFTNAAAWQRSSFVAS